MKQSKISKALQYLKDHPGATAYEAAKVSGLPPSPVYKRIKKDLADKNGICPSCGQRI